MNVPQEKELGGKDLASVPNTGLMQTPPREPRFTAAFRMTSSEVKSSSAFGNT
jgi:hypothetical protein